MKKTKKLSILVKGIFLLVALFFSSGIYLSIPVLFNYKSVESLIEKKFYSDFNINLNISGDIKYQLLPKPHLLISDSNLSINEPDKGDMSTEIKNLKVFLSVKSLYPKSNVNFEKFEIKNKNFLLKKTDYDALRNYLHNNESKPFQIKKSKIFVLDDQDQTLIISPIEKINYFSSVKDNFKKLNIKGNIFDLNFKSQWKKLYDTKKESEIEVDFRNPNIFIKNKINYDDISNLNGSVFFDFLNQNIEIDYQLKNNSLFLKSPDNINDIKIDALIELKPFNLNSNIYLNRLKLNFLIDEFLFSIINLEPNLIGNLNGDINFQFTNLDHELISDGKIKFLVGQNTVNIINSIFNFSGIGKIISKLEYKEINGDIIFSSLNSLEIENKKGFAKKFQLKFSKIENLEEISFKIEKNINKSEILISDIKINQQLYKNKNDNNLKYNVKNTQELKSLVKKIIND